MTEKRNMLTWGLIALAAVALNVYLTANVVAPRWMPPRDDDIVPLGMTHLTGLQIQGSETDALVVDQQSTGDIVEFRDNGTVVWRIADGGLQSTLGQCLDLDADADTSICADTDDQIDFELGAADIYVMKQYGASTITTDTTTHLLEIQDATNIMTGGTNSLSALNIDLGIGNSTGGTNNVYGILIDGIVQDASNTETGIQIANGWDRGLDLDGNSLYMDNDQDSYFSELADDSIGFTPGAATGSLEVRSGNLQVGDGGPDETHDGEDFYCEGISEFDGAAYFDGAVDFDGVVNLVVGTEHIGVPTLVSTAIVSDANDGALFTIGDGEIWLVHGAWVNVTTNFDCDADCTLILGDGNDTDGFCVLADAELQAADTEATGFAAGWQCQVAATRGVYQDATGGFWYAPSGAPETIDVDVGGTNLAAGGATIYLLYTRIQ